MPPSHTLLCGFLGVSDLSLLNSQSQSFPSAPGTPNMDVHEVVQDTSSASCPYLNGSVPPSNFTSTAKATGSKEMRVVATRQ